MKTHTLPSAEGDFERLLLDSARDDRAPRAARLRIAASLGVRPDRASGAQAPGDARGAGRAEVIRSVKSAGLNALAKYTLIALVGGLAASPGSPAETRLPAAVVAPTGLPDAREVQREAINPPTLAAAETLTSPDEPAAPKSVPHAERRAVRPSRAALAASAERLEAASGSARSVELLLREVQQLDRARAALEASRIVLALGELDAYASQFPQGELGLEAAVLRVRTLQRAGRFGSAARVARRALELPNNARYRDELLRIAGAERTPLDKTPGPSTLQERR